MGVGTDLQRRVSEALTIRDALRLICSSGAPEGVLRVIALRASGRVAIRARWIEGATITNSSIQGVPALERLMSYAATGLFQYCPIAASESILHEQGLGIDINALLNDSSFGVLPPTRESFELSHDPIQEILQATAGLNERQRFLLEEFGMLQSQEERQAFFDSNPAFQELFACESLNPDQLRLLSLYASISSSQDQKAFLQQNPDFRRALQEQSLVIARRAQLLQARDQTLDKTIQSAGINPKALNPAELHNLRQSYQQLATREARNSFLAHNPQFVEQMDQEGLTEDQRKDLVNARQAAIERDMAAFIAFQKQLLGSDTSTLAEEQIDMLRRMFLELATEHSRSQFLEKNPLLQEDLPVLRGEEAASFLASNLDAIETPSVSNEDERRRQLDALSLTAHDAAFLEEFAEIDQKKFIEKPFHRFRSVSKEQLKTTLSWSAIVIVMLCMGFIAFAYLNRNAPPPVYLEEGEIGDELLSMQIDEALQEEVPSLLTQETYTGTRKGSSQTNPFYSKRSIEDQEAASERMKVAERLEQEEKFDLAVESYLDCIEQYPNFLPARIALIKLYLKMKNYEKARELCIATLKKTRPGPQRDLVFAFYKMSMTTGHQQEKDKPTSR